MIASIPRHVPFAVAKLLSDPLSIPVIVRIAALARAAEWVQSDKIRRLPTDGRAIYFFSLSESIGIWRSINGACIIIALECGRVCNIGARRARAVERPLEPPALSAAREDCASRQRPRPGTTHAAQHPPTHTPYPACTRGGGIYLALLWIYCSEEILHSKLYFYAALVGTFFVLHSHALQQKRPLSSLSNKSQWQLWEKNVSPVRTHLRPHAWMKTP